MITTPIEILKKYWKHQAFRQPQESIIDTVLQGNNTIVLLPTGAGKSICYQVPALIKQGVCVVVSPLIALMEDQVESLKNKDIKATTISASLSKNELAQLFDNILFGGIKFLYLSPERLQSEFIQEKLKQLNVSIIAIDEAHCISEWGHDFRPSYRKINKLIELHPEATVIALTASATTKVFDDIKSNLSIKDAVSFKTSLSRKELTYQVVKTENINFQVIEILKKTSAPSIIYTTSRKSTKNLHAYLISKKFLASYYHGGLNYDEKKEAYNKWVKEETPIMIATNAFGMGIDKNNVTTIIHIDLPFSLENYIQESGRAGRNSTNSNAFLLYNEATVQEFQKRYKKSIVSINELKEIYKKLNQYVRIAKGELSEEAYHLELPAFCDQYNFTMVKVFNALDILEKEGVLEFENNSRKKSLLKINLSQKELLNYDNSTYSELLKTCLRTYAGLFENFIRIDEFILAKKLNISINEIVISLNKLNERGYITYKPKYLGNTLRFLVPREDNYTINTISKNVSQRQIIKKEKVKSVLGYVTNESICRNVFLMNYFDQTEVEKCGRCDICIAGKRNKANHSIDEIAIKICTLLEQEEVSPKNLISNLHFNQNQVIEVLQLLLEKGRITLTSQNKFQINKDA